MSELFSEVTVGPLKLPNRIVVAPMCQFSMPDGEAGDWHLMHLGTLALSGAGLLLIESTGVLPEGRITHADLGLWNDRQQAALARTLAAIRRYSDTRIGIQLSHAGRKAAEPAPGDGVKAFAADDPRSWVVVAPSALPVSKHAPQTRALDAVGIDAVVDAFAAGITHVWHGFHPRPTLSAHLPGQRIQLTAHQRFRQRGVGQVGSGIAFREQVVADAAARRRVGVQPGEAHQRMRGVDFAFGQAFAQRGHTALPFGRTVERGILKRCSLRPACRPASPSTRQCRAASRPAPSCGRSARDRPDSRAACSACCASWSSPP